MRPWFGSDSVQSLWLEVWKVLAIVFGDVLKLLFLPLLVCICEGMILRVVVKLVFEYVIWIHQGPPCVEFTSSHGVCSPLAVLCTHLRATVG